VNIGKNKPVEISPGLKLDGLPSAAEAVAENKAFNAALEALLHPKPDFFRGL
jgi:hypothetical protein